MKGHGEIMNMHGSNELSDLDIVQNITEMKGILKDHEHAIKRNTDDIKLVKEQTAVIHDLSQNMAGMVVSLQYMKENLASIDGAQKDIKNEVSTINDKINDIENRPANETRSRMLDIRDKVVVSVLSAAAGAALAALLSIIVK